MGNTALSVDQRNSKDPPGIPLIYFELHFKFRRQLRSKVTTSLVFVTKVTMTLLSPPHVTMEWPSVLERASLLFRHRKSSAASKIVAAAQN